MSLPPNAASAGPAARMSVLHSMKLGIDVNRQKEVIAKAVSAVLLLLLKHLKLNHVYQFEFVSQHLVFANCIPLVLKFFNQDIVQYVTAKNRCVGVVCDERHWCFGGVPLCIRLCAMLLEFLIS